MGTFEVGGRLTLRVRAFDATLERDGKLFHPKNLLYTATLQPSSGDARVVWYRLFPVVSYPDKAENLGRGPLSPKGFAFGTDGVRIGVVYKRWGFLPFDEFPADGNVDVAREVGRVCVLHQDAAPEGSEPGSFIPLRRLIADGRTESEIAVDLRDIEAFGSLRLFSRDGAWHVEVEARGKRWKFVHGDKGEWARA